MAPPPVSIYVTSLTSQPKVRQNIELLRRSLRGLEIPYTEHDLVMEEDAKTRWQRAKPSGQIIGLPGYLVGGEYIGNMDDFEHAAETATLESFLRQDTDLAANQSIGEAELERLMREMSDADLDALALEVGKDGGEAKPKEKESTTSILPQLKNLNIGSTASESTKGVSSAAESTLSTITQKAAELIQGLGGPEPHTGTSDVAHTPSPTTSAFASKSIPKELIATSGEESKVISTPVETSETTPPTTSTSTSTKAVPGEKERASPPPSSFSTPVIDGEIKERPRRMSKQEIAEQMMSADSVDGLLESLGLAGGQGGEDDKEKKEKKE